MATTKLQFSQKKAMSLGKSSAIFTIITVILTIAFLVYANYQQDLFLSKNISTALDTTNVSSYEHIGGTEQVRFYIAHADDNEYLVRINPFRRVIDSYNLSERPEVVDYFKQHYDINL